MYFFVPGQCAPLLAWDSMNTVSAIASMPAVRWQQSVDFVVGDDRQIDLEAERGADGQRGARLTQARAPASASVSAWKNTGRGSLRELMVAPHPA